MLSRSGASMRKQLARQGAVFVAFVYIAGLLIVNIDLGLYGTSYIELARAQYLLVGSMWFLFSIAFPIGSAAAWVTARKKFSPTVTWAMGAVAVAAGFIPALLVCYIARW